MFLPMKNVVGFIMPYMYICIYTYDYLKKISIKINVATDEGNNRNEIEH